MIAGWDILAPLARAVSVLISPDREQRRYCTVIRLSYDEGAGTGRHACTCPFCTATRETRLLVERLERGDAYAVYMGEVSFVTGGRALVGDLHHALLTGTAPHGRPSLREWSVRPPVYVSILELDDARPSDRVRFVHVGDAVRMVVEGTAEFDAPIALDCSVEEYRRQRGDR